MLSMFLAAAAGEPTRHRLAVERFAFGLRATPFFANFTQLMNDQGYRV